jgi:phosphoketolase
MSDTTPSWNKEPLPTMPASSTNTKITVTDATSANAKLKGTDTTPSQQQSEWELLEEARCMLEQGIKLLDESLQVPVDDTAMSRQLVAQEQGRLLIKQSLARLKMIPNVIPTLSQHLSSIGEEIEKEKKHDPNWPNDADFAEYNAGLDDAISIINTHIKALEDK